MAVKLNMLKSFSLRFLLALSFFIVPKGAMATEIEEGISLSFSNPVVLQSIILVLIIFIILVLIYTLVAFQTFMKKLMKELPEKALEPSMSWWEQLKLKMTDAVPVEQEAVVLTDHEYDGIRELDNNLPP
ncbi:MAG: cbb3-type cytochrome c oxidase N-terminal domain-containing protein, partial [Cytophagaceae bacterium]